MENRTVEKISKNGQKLSRNHFLYFKGKWFGGLVDGGDITLCFSPQITCDDGEFIMSITKNSLSNNPYEFSGTIKDKHGIAYVTGKFIENRIEFIKKYTNGFRKEHRAGTELKTEILTQDPIFYSGKRNLIGKYKGDWYKKSYGYVKFKFELQKIAQ